MTLRKLSFRKNTHSIFHIRYYVGSLTTHTCFIDTLHQANPSPLYCRFPMIFFSTKKWNKKNIDRSEFDSRSAHLCYGWRQCEFISIDLRIPKLVFAIFINLFSNKYGTSIPICVPCDDVALESIYAAIAVQTKKTIKLFAIAQLNCNNASLLSQTTTAINKNFAFCIPLTNAMSYSIFFVAFLHLWLFLWFVTTKFYQFIYCMCVYEKRNASHIPKSRLKLNEANTN